MGQKSSRFLRRISTSLTSSHHHHHASSSPSSVPHLVTTPSVESDAFGTSLLQNLPQPLFCWSSSSSSITASTRCPSSIQLFTLLTADDSSWHDCPAPLLTLIIEYTRHIYHILAIARRREDYDIADDDDAETDPITDRSVMVAEWPALQLPVNVALLPSYLKDPSRRNNGTTAAGNGNAADRTYPLLEYDRHPLFPIGLTHDHGHTIMVMDEYSHGTPMYCYTYYNHPNDTKVVSSLAASAASSPSSSSSSPAVASSSSSSSSTSSSSVGAWSRSLIHEKLMRRWNMAILNGRLVGINRYGLTMTCPIPSPISAAATAATASGVATGSSDEKRAEETQAILLPQPRMTIDSYIFGDDVCQVVSGDRWYVYAPETETSPPRGEVYRSEMGQWHSVVTPPSMTYGRKVILASVPSIGGILEFPGWTLPNRDGDDEAFDYGATHVVPLNAPPSLRVHYYDALTDTWSLVAWNLDGIHFMTRVRYVWIIEDNDGYAACSSSLALSSRVTVVLIGHHSLRGDTQWIRRFDSLHDLVAAPSSPLSPAAVRPASPSSLSSPASPSSDNDDSISTRTPKQHCDGDDGWHLIRSFGLMGLDFTIKDFTLA